MRTHFGLPLVGLLILALLLSSCSQQKIPNADHAYVVFDSSQGPIGVRVEIADTEPTRERGLMHRTALGEQSGMLFVFGQPQTVGFWMKNTKIPLDMLMIGRDWKVRQIIHDAKPCTADPCEEYYSNDPVQYVIELNAGFAVQHGIGPGTKATLVTQDSRKPRT